MTCINCDFFCIYFVLYLQGKGKLGYVGDRTIKLINCETDQMVKVIITRFDKNDKKLVHAITYN